MQQPSALDRLRVRAGVRTRARSAARRARHGLAAALVGERGEFFRFASRYTDVLGTGADGVALVVPTYDHEMGLRLFRDARFGLEDMRTLVDLLAARLGRHPLRGLEMIEVGGNIGSTTLQALTALGAARVHVLEPVPANVRLLRANLELNGLREQAVVHQVAASAEPGSLRLTLSPDNSGDNRVAPGAVDAILDSWEPHDRREVITVPAVTLDDLAATAGVDPGRVGMIWIDAQGHEPWILDGASSLLAAGVPLICEYWPAGLTRAGGLERFEELVAARFTHFADVAPVGGRAAAEPRRVDEIRAHRAFYGGEAFTELALWTEDRAAQDPPGAGT